MTQHTLHDLAGDLDRIETLDRLHAQGLRRFDVAEKVVDEEAPFRRDAEAPAGQEVYLRIRLAHAHF